jgi:hypothetical protein
MHAMWAHAVFCRGEQLTNAGAYNVRSNPHLKEAVCLLSQGL